MTRKTASKNATAPKKGKSATRATSPRPAARAAESPKAAKGATTPKATPNAKASKAADGKAAKPATGKAGPVKAKAKAALPKKASAKASPPKPAEAVDATTAPATDASTSPATPTPATATPATLTPATPAPKGAAKVADQIVTAGDSAAVLAQAEGYSSDKPTTAAAAARVIDELIARKPDMAVPIIDRFVHAVTGRQKRLVQTAAAALPVMARIAPARVARHLPALTSGFERSSETGKDGLVSTFAALCTASVAYQKRLEPVLGLALRTADPKTLQRWAEVVLPSLKGEPHARARAVVEDRLGDIPRQYAQPIASFLGVKLRPAHLR